MSKNSKNPNQEKSLADRLRDRLSLDSKKSSSDSKNFNSVSPDSILNPRIRVGGNGRPITTPPSSSSSSSDSISEKTGNRPYSGRSERGGNNSGELSVSSGNSPKAADSIRSNASNFNLGHRRSSSGSTPLIKSSRSAGSSGSKGSGDGGGGGGTGGSVNSRTVNLLPAGNICPSGKILTTGMTARNPPGSDVLALGSGTGHYGHGSIMRGAGGGKPSRSSSGSTKVGNVDIHGGGSGGGGGRSSSSGSEINKALASCDLEVVKEAGNAQYRSGNFLEALSLYNRGITIAPNNAICRSNKAAALMGLGRLAEAVQECEEAVKLDPTYVRAQQRLGCLHLRLGQVENARKHLCSSGKQPDLKKLQEVEKHLDRCFGIRSISDWGSVLKEANAAIEAGADSSPQLFACRVEALLKLHRIVEANSGLSDIPRFDPYPTSCSRTKFFGMLAEAYVFHVRAQVEMALGRFENAIALGQKAEMIDPSSLEVSKMLHNVRLIKKACDRGDCYFNDHKFPEGASAYGEGLKYDSSNSVLRCKRADCWSNLEQWDKCVEECDNVLRIHPTHKKALQQRAQAYEKLGRSAESKRDYELLRKEISGDNKVAEVESQAQVALRKWHEGEVQNLRVSSKVEEVSDLDRFKALIFSSGISVIYFKATANQQCEQISPFVDMLSIRYPSVRFVKVDVRESLGITTLMNVSTEVPAFRMYKNGNKVMEMISPSRNVLESAVKEYSL